MDFPEVVRRRRMVRDYTDDPIAGEVVDRILDAGRRAPTAGFTQAIDLLVLEGPAQTERFWSCTFAAGARASFRWQGLFRAPLLVVPWSSPAAYLDRYAEPDKAATGLGASEDRWPIPYWFTDAAMAAQNMLLAAVDEHLGALFFGIFTGEEALRAEFGVPAGHRAVGAIAVGHPAADDPGRSAERPRRTFDDVVHRGTW